MRMNNKILFNGNQLLPTFDHTVTLLHKSKDVTTKLDIWTATVYENCSFSQRTERTVSGATVSIGGYYICRIPKQIEFDCAVGDYIIKDRLFTGEVPTSSTIMNIYQAHKPGAFMVKSYTDDTNTIELAEHYHIEGI